MSGRAQQPESHPQNKCPLHRKGLLRVQGLVISRRLNILEVTDLISRPRN